ncbi:hypothetical protein DV737_g1292, partial [Chaetothyriales sp. CBS 132003]
MRFFTALATFGLVALVSAQTVTDSTSTPASSTESSATASASLSTEEKCLQACDASDICCQAACVSVPCPSQLQANQTTECAAQCPQGDGSSDETSSYAACQASCISSLFFSSSAATGTVATGSGSAASVSATATSGSGSRASSGSASTGASGSSGSGSGTASATGSAASSSSTNSAMSSARSSWSDCSGHSSNTLPATATPRDRPLVEYCTNEWLENPQNDSSAYLSVDNVRPLHEALFDWLDKWIDECLLVVKAPRFRRLVLGLSIFVVGALFLWLKVVGPWVVQERAIWRSLNEDVSKSAGGLFGSNARPHFAGMVYIRDMDSHYLPSENSPKKRLIFVGDIHGCKAELLALMAKVQFNPETDHLIAVGDVVNKGPDSPGVIDFLMANNASCVRGNHEDALLLMASDMASSALRSHNGKYHSVGKPKGKDALAKLILQLSQEQLDWLQSLPVVLKVGNVKGIGDMIVVHAGLVPGVPLDAQDPFSVMNMRTIDLATHSPSKFHAREGSLPWFRLWTRYQTILHGHLKWKSLVGKPTAHLDTPAFVVYGHDARTGLQMGRDRASSQCSIVELGPLIPILPNAADFSFVFEGLRDPKSPIAFMMGPEWQEIPPSRLRASSDPSTTNRKKFMHQLMLKRYRDDDESESIGAVREQHARDMADLQSINQDLTWDLQESLAHERDQAERADFFEGMFQSARQRLKIARRVRAQVLETLSSVRETMDELEMDILSMRHNMRASEGTIKALREGRDAKALQPSPVFIQPLQHLSMPAESWRSFSTEATSPSSRTLTGELGNAWSFHQDSSGWSSSLMGSKPSPSIQLCSRRDRHQDESAGELEALNRSLRTMKELHRRPVAEMAQVHEEGDRRADDRPAESVKNDRVKKIREEIAAAAPPAPASERLVECLARVVMAIDEAQSERQTRGLPAFDFGLCVGRDGQVLIETGHKSESQLSETETPWSQRADEPLSSCPAAMHRSASTGSRSTTKNTARKALRLWLARTSASALKLAVCLVLFTLINVLIAIKEEWRYGNVSNAKRDEIMSWRSDLVGWDVIDWIRYRVAIWLDANRELNV